jgi:hypothetical protein
MIVVDLLEQELAPLLADARYIEVRHMTRAVLDAVCRVSSIIHRFYAHSRLD